MVFLFKLKINHVKMIVVDDLLANWNLMFSLKLQKINWAKTRMVDDFLVTCRGVYQNMSCWFLQQVIEILFWGHDFIIDHVMSSRSSTISWGIMFFPFPFAIDFFLFAWTSQPPKLASFFWKLVSWLSLSAISNGEVQYQGHSMYQLQSSRWFGDQSLRRSLWYIVLSIFGYC
jgi:hypothetical protein